MRVSSCSSLGLTPQPLFFLYAPPPYPYQPIVVALPSTIEPSTTDTTPSIDESPSTDAHLSAYFSVLVRVPIHSSYGSYGVPPPYPPLYRAPHAFQPTYDAPPTYGATALSHASLDTVVPSSSLNDTTFNESAYYGALQFQN